MKQPKTVTLCPTTVAQPIPAAAQYGFVSYASFGRIIKALQELKELRDGDVAGVMIDQRGITFLFE